MKATTLKTLRAVRQSLVLGCLVSAAIFPGASYATDSVWENSGTITFAPQIDATNFVNTGLIDIFGTLPFETSNTRNFTNSGLMISSPGWRFDDAASNLGVRVPADNFVNLNGGVVQALDELGFAVVIVGGGTIGSANTPSSYLWIDASNVVNKGTLSVGGGGWLKVIGTNVNMARGALEVTALQPIGSSIIGETNYINDAGIDDVYWGQTNLNFNTANIYNGTRATAPPHPVQIGIGGPTVFRSFSLNQPLSWGYSNVTDFVPLTLTNSDGSFTNIVVPTNIVKQAVFVSIADPSIMSAAVSFFPSSTITNPFQTVCVQLALQSTNVITGEIEATPLYFYDRLASETNRGLMVNIGGTALPPFVSQRPANYDISRIDDGRFALGAPGNVVPDPTYLYDSTFSNRVVAGEYAGYSASIDNLASEPPPTVPGTVTNFPGRVQVYADSLDLRSTRIRGEGEVVLKATHLLSSVGAAIDCENLSYTLGSTNGFLNVAGLTRDSVTRLKGTLLAWSGLWTNSMNLIITNNFVVTNTVDTNGVVTGTNAISSPLTNFVTIDFHVLILDGSRLAARLPVTTWDLVTHSTNIVLSDNINVVGSLFLDGQSLTVDGNLNLTSRTLQNTLGQSITTELTEWVYTNAPGLLYLTNNGLITVPSEAHFGDDRPIPYSAFVNKGSLRAGSLDVSSTYIENDGSMAATIGPLSLVGSNAKFQGGQTTSGGDVNLTFSDAQFFNHHLNVAGALNINVPQGLSDAGPSSGNVFNSQFGFNLLVKPNTGDLLGTTLQDSPPNFVEVDNSWAGEDRGANASGYSDNAAVGKLVLTVQSLLPTQIPLFSFTGTTGHNGLYVDVLDLSSLGTNFAAMLQIDPSITIYYAAAKLGFTPPANTSGIPQEPEEFLNGQFGGHLVWVNGFAGPNSSTTVLVNGQTVVMNTALRNSKVIDSDGDGVPNFFDSTPLGGSGGTPPAGQVVLGPGFFNRAGSQQVFSLSWNAQANTSYRVEMTTDLAHPSWQLVTTYNNTLPTAANVTISDTNNVSGHQRFYRVRIAP